MAHTARSASGDATAAPENLSAVRACAALLQAERRSVARELHHAPVQLLAAASLRLQLAVADGDSRSTLDIAVREVEAAMVALREMMSRLASTEVGAGVLDDAVAHLDGTPPQGTGAPVSIEEAAQAVVVHAAAGATRS